MLASDNFRRELERDQDLASWIVRAASQMEMLRAPESLPVSFSSGAVGRLHLNAEGRCAATIWWRPACGDELRVPAQHGTSSYR